MHDLTRNLVTDQELLARLRDSVLHTQRCCAQTWIVIRDTRHFLASFPPVDAPVIRKSMDSAPEPGTLGAPRG
jgi:hypothetical protein